MTVEDLIGPLNKMEHKHAPEKLWIGGDASIFESGTLVSVVGSRSASPEGIRRARKLARELIRRDFVVVSGLARGIDTVAHETAVKYQGRTVAVLATPLDRTSPPGNSALQRRIIRDHLAVTQFPPGSPIRKMNFTIRNRTMALLSAATVIVEAGPNSGTRHQGWEALRLGRPLFILESAAKSTDIQWIGKLREYGAEVLNGSNISEPLSERSRTHVRALVKSGNVRVMEMAADRIKDRNLFPGYFGAGFLLVPVPGHAPMLTPTVWPAAMIAEALVSRGIAQRWEPALERRTAVPKSATSHGRRTVDRHLQTIKAIPLFDDPRRIVVVDDVITSGATLFAATDIIAKACPDAVVKAFALIRTLSSQEIPVTLLSVSIRKSAPSRGTQMGRRLGIRNRAQWRAGTRGGRAVDELRRGWYLYGMTLAATSRVWWRAFG